MNWKITIQLNSINFLQYFTYNFNHVRTQGLLYKCCIGVKVMYNREQKNVPLSATWVPVATQQITLVNEE